MSSRSHDKSEQPSNLGGESAGPFDDAWEDWEFIDPDPYDDPRSDEDNPNNNPPDGHLPPDDVLMYETFSDSDQSSDENGDSSGDDGKSIGSSNTDHSLGGEDPDGDEGSTHAWRNDDIYDIFDQNATEDIFDKDPYEDYWWISCGWEHLVSTGRPPLSEPEPSLPSGEQRNTTAITGSEGEDMVSENLSSTVADGDEERIRDVG